MLTVSHVRKQYSTVLAVDDVSLTVESGQILGLLGPNGAGKTTTIRMILNIIRPDSGTITFDGLPFDDGVRNRIGYLPEERGLYRKSTLLNTILYFASLKGIEKDEAKRRAYDWLKRFDLLNYYNQPVEALSKGNQQKVQFVISILHQPSLVILDEPFSGLDPVNQILLNEILMELKQQGKSIIFSTHQMDQAEKSCDTLCLINKGKVVLEGGVAAVKERYGKNTIHIEYDGNGSSLKDFPGVRTAHVYENFAELVLEDHCRPAEFLREAAKVLDVKKFQTTEPSLNSIFLEVVGSPPAADEAQTMPIGKAQHVPDLREDPRVKKAFQGVIIGAALTSVGLVMTIVRHTISWEATGLFALIVIVSVYKYLRVRKIVRAESLRTQVGG